MLAPELRRRSASSVYRCFCYCKRVWCEVIDSVAADLFSAIHDSERASFVNADTKMDVDTSVKDQAAPGNDKTEFAKRNPYLERLVPDAIENAVDALIPDKVEKVRSDS